MPGHHDVDYVIIGQGLAGSVLALKLLAKGATVMVYDSPDANTSSVIAAGLMNPVTGKRMTLTWLAEEFFTTARAFYHKVEKQLNVNFLHELPIYRVFGSIGEQNDWAAKIGNEKYHAFIKDNSIGHNLSDAYNESFMSLRVDGGGRVDVKTFIEATRGFLLSQGVFKEREILRADITSIGDAYAIDDVRTKQVVFCTGLDQDVWRFLPFTPMKGEVLHIKADLPRDRIVVGGCFLSPDDAGQFYAGATYDWRNVDTNITASGKEEILNKLAKFLNQSVQVAEHKAGIRPAVRDRRPLLGEHPELSGFYLFSGLGSKGVSMAPYLADCLIDLIENDKPLAKEMDLKRHL